MKKYIILSFIFFFLGCSNYTYPILKPIKGLSVLEKGGRMGSCLFKQYGFSRVYKVEKKDFSLYIILGDKYYPRLYLGAKDKNGNLLEITSDVNYDEFKIHPLSRNETKPFDNKVKNQYGISKIYNFVISINNTGKSTIMSSGQIKLYLHDKKGKKIGEVELQSDFKSNKCVSVAFI